MGDPGGVRRRIRAYEAGASSVGSVSTEVRGTRVIRGTPIRQEWAAGKHSVFVPEFLDRLLRCDELRLPSGVDELVRQARPSPSCSPRPAPTARGTATAGRPPTLCGAGSSRRGAGSPPSTRKRTVRLSPISRTIRCWCRSSAPRPSSCSACGTGPPAPSRPRAGCHQQLQRRLPDINASLENSGTLKSCSRALESEGNISTPRGRSPLFVGPFPDVICHSQTPPPQEPQEPMQRTSAATARVGNSPPN